MIEYSVLEKGSDISLTFICLFSLLDVVLSVAKHPKLHFTLNLI